MLTQQFLDHLKDISVTPLAAPATLDLDGFAASANRIVRPHSEEGVATNLLTPLGDSSRNACAPVRRLRERRNRVSRSALTDFTTGTKVADRARRAKSLKSG